VFHEVPREGTHNSTVTHKEESSKCGTKWNLHSSSIVLLTYTGKHPLSCQKVLRQPSFNSAQRLNQLAYLLGSPSPLHSVKNKSYWLEGNKQAIGG
jgi:hypothetical protein